MDSQPPIASNLSYVSEEKIFHTSVSDAPPPSFLVQTPLGTPPEETIVDQKSIQTIDRKQHEQKVSYFPAPVQQKRKSKVKPSNRHVKLRSKARKDGFVQQWVYEEVRLSMSKMSIMSLVLGLLFLGALFFIIGFLAAVSTLKSDTAHSAHSAWKTSNTAEHEENGGLGDSPLGGLAQKFGGKLGKKFTPITKMMGKGKPKVPKALQPFARYAIGKPSHKGAGKSGKNPFDTHRGRGYQGQQPGTQQPQPYPAPGGYPPGYQQPMPFPPGGQPQAGYPQAGYGQMPPQQPMQQPYYQQQAMPQQQMYPQQSQIVQQNQYPQQMAPPQPGYYR